MKRFLMIAALLVLLGTLATGSVLYLRSQRARAAADIAAVQRLDQDLHMTVVMNSLRASSVTGRLAIVNVNLVDPVADAIVPAQTVVVAGERVEWVGAAAKTPSLKGVTIIDGAGRYLSPGLTDMHVHTEHMAQHLLRLATGVTSVRDMDGFPWLLNTRRAIESGAMIGATTYVAGTIIADQPLSGYAVVVHTPQEAREIVRKQAQCGYAFIKVHNSLAEPLFDAVADEARRMHLDLVGHVPHDISLQHAVQSGRMRTLEHLKGFLIDQTLLPSDEPFAPALQGAQVWLTPTLYGRVGNAYGAEARRLETDARQRYSPRARREEWHANVPAAGSNDAKSHDRLIATQAIVMKRLLPLNPRWLTGTDAAGYSFNIAGFSALDEMVLLHQAGISNAQVVRSATSEPAVAMRRTDEYGRIESGLRADLVLLSGNPLDDVAVYQANLGVVARGRWYDRSSLDAALEGVARIYDEPMMHSLDRATVKTLAVRTRDSVKIGFVFEDAALNAAADAFTRTGARAAAKMLRQLIAAPITGACAAMTPV